MSKKFNVVFPIGKTPEINFIESKIVEKDCYVFWDMEYLIVKPSWIVDLPDKNKEIYSINSLIHRCERLESQNKIMREALESISASHVKIESIEKWDFKDAKAVILHDTKLARKVLKQINETKE